MRNTSFSKDSDCCAFAPWSFRKLPKNTTSRNYIITNKRLSRVKEPVQNVSLWSQVSQSIMVASARASVLWLITAGSQPEAGRKKIIDRLVMCFGRAWGGRVIQANVLLTRSMVAAGNFCEAFAGSRDTCLWSIPEETDAVHTCYSTSTLIWVSYKKPSSSYGVMLEG